MSVFGIFHKNKRFGYHSHRRVFVAMFLSLLCCMVVSLVLNAMAEQEPVKSIEFTSEHSDFENGDKGAWIVTKSAKWIDTGKAEVTININSIKRSSIGHKKDIVLVADDSGMGNGIEQIKSDCAYFINELLADEGNRIALISYHSEANILADFTNNKGILLGLVDGLVSRDEKDLSAAFKRADELLTNYTPEENCELIMIVIAHGYPNLNTPNEVGEYRTLKAKYPYMTINAVQYSTGGSIIRPLTNSSDFQYVADSNSLRNVLLEAADVPYVYDDLVISDYVDGNYWVINQADFIESTRGTTTIGQSDNNPTVEWDLGEIHHSGQKDSLTFTITLREEYYNVFGSLLVPTNAGINVISSMKEIQDENVSKTETPIIKDHYNVHYDANSPSDCTVSGVVPDDATYTIFTTVAISQNQLTCQGWVFQGWKTITRAAKLVNDDYFRMPEEDVELRAAWAKLSIGKSLDGTPHIRGNAMFADGETVNNKIFALTGHDKEDSEEYEWWDDGDFFGNQEIKKIVRAYTIPGWVDTDDEQYLLSAEYSQLPIYGWHDDDTLYYYSNGDVIYMNYNASYMFNGLDQLTDISGLSQIDTSNVEYMAYMFQYDHNLTDLSPIAGWDVSGVYDMENMFEWCYGLTTLESLIDWEVTLLSDMSYMFNEVTDITSLHGLENWRPTELTTLDYTFPIENLSDISALSGWRLPYLYSMWSTFADTRITNLDALADWGGDEPGGLYVSDFSNTFSGTDLLTDISGLENWQPENVTWLSGMFANSGIDSIDVMADWGVAPTRSLDYFIMNTEVSDISIMANWDLSKVTTMNYTFEGTNISDISVLNLPLKVLHIAYVFAYTNVSDISPLASWNTDNLSSFFGAFDHTKISNLTPLQNWNVTKPQTYSNLFAYTNITNLDALSQWQTNGATSFYGTFSGTHLTDISGIRNWNTAKITELNYTFKGQTGLTNFSPISGWVLPVVNSLKGTFQNTGITDLTQISGWNTANVTNMEDLFNGASNVTSLNGLGGWNVEKLRILNRTFKNMTNLANISALSGWTTTSLNDLTETFYGDSLITDLSSLNSWDTSKVTRKSATFNGIPSSITRPTWY